MTITLKQGHSNHKFVEYYDQYFSDISLNSSYNHRDVERLDITVFTSECWRNDTTFVYLSYCMYSNINFDTVKRHNQWYHSNSYYVHNDLNIDIDMEASQFHTYLQADSFISNMRENSFDTPLFDILNVNLNDTLFNFIITKYNLNVVSIYTGNKNNVSLYE